MSKPKAVTELLIEQDSHPLAKAIHRGKKLQQLSRLIQTFLDPELAGHCHVLNLRGTSLLLATDATVWATRLRYQIPMLLQALQQHASLKELKDIQIRVIPSNRATPPKQTKRPLALSVDSAHCLQQCAETISDPALSQALQRLASRRRK